MKNYRGVITAGTIRARVNRRRKDSRCEEVKEEWGEEMMGNCRGGLAGIRIPIRSRKMRISEGESEGAEKKIKLT